MTDLERLNDDAFSSIYKNFMTQLMSVLDFVLYQLIPFFLTSKSLSRSCTYAFLIPKDFPQLASNNITTRSEMNGAKNTPDAISSNIVENFVTFYDFKQFMSIITQVRDEKNQRS